MKHAALYEEAKRLYVIEGFSLDAIVELLKNQVSRKTLYNWRTQHHWDDQRRQYLATNEDLQREVIEITRQAIKEAKANPTPHNIYAVAKALSALKLLQGIDTEESDTPSEKPKGLSKETAELIQREILGMP